MKNIYYKGLNSFTLRQFSSKINTMTFSMTIICLMLFITICVLSSAMSMKISMTNNLKKLAPADVQIGKFINVTDYEYYSEKQIEDSKISIYDTLEKLGYDVDNKLKDIVKLDVYNFDNIDLKTSIGSYYDIAKDKYPLMPYNKKESIVKISDYNKIAKLFGLKEYTLNDDEYFIVANYSEYVEFRNEGLKAHTILNNAVNDSMKKYEYLTANYNVTDINEKNLSEKELSEICKENSNNTVIDFDSKMTIKENSIGLGAMVTFIGLYLGIIFLISCAAILALKELSESSDNVEKFNMLRKIGVDEKMINKALFRQIGIFFMFPLLVAIIHSVFGIKFCNFLLSAFGAANLVSSIIGVAIFIVAIYGGYFLVTYICSKNIIKEK